MTKGRRPAGPSTLANSYAFRQASRRPPSLEQLVTFASRLVLISAGFLIPVMWGIYWGSRHVDPGRLGVLLQAEAVLGIDSAALLTGEPFGVR